jgi:hypothetical protein
MNQESISTHEEQTESQEHIDEMVAKSDELDRLNDPSQGDRPDWLPEKFKNAEQMAEAYGHLEKKLGGESVEEGVEPEAAPEPTPQQEASDVREAVENAGVDFDSLQAEYNEQGQLSEDAYTKLTEAGFPQDLVNSWIQGQEALANNYQKAVYESVGGEQAYSDMINWAGDNLSDNEIAAFDRAVGSGDVDMVKLAVSGLQTQYQAAEGTDPSLIGGQSSNSTGGNYSSWAEVTQAMSDPRYNSDPAYRQSVSTKIARSNIQ